MDRIRSLLPRPRYLERIRPHIGSSLIKALVGQRRAGKSCVLYQVEALIRDEHPDWETLFIDLERNEWRHVRNAENLIAEVESRLPQSGRLALFIDEVQEVEGYDRAIRGFAADGRFDLYISGSSADLLSGDVATIFAGRAVRIMVHPLAYDEFLVFHGLGDSDESLGRFLRYGGMPFLRELSLEDGTALEYLRGVLDTVVLRDVVLRHGIRSPALLERIVEFIADNVGSPSSARNAANWLRSRGIETSVQSVLDYIGYLVGSFAIHRCAASDIVGKRILEGNDKFYFEDLGIRRALRSFADNDVGKIVENSVYCRLRSDGWDVASGRIGSAEIDFVCEKGGQRRYVQAAYLVPDGTTRKRELASLLAAPDAWPRFLVSMDPLVADHEGIRHLRLRDFLRDGLPY